MFAFGQAVKVFLPGKGCDAAALAGVQQTLWPGLEQSSDSDHY